MKMFFSSLSQNSAISLSAQNNESMTKFATV